MLDGVHIINVLNYYHHFIHAADKLYLEAGIRKVLEFCGLDFLAAVPIRFLVPAYV